MKFFTPLIFFICPFAYGGAVIDTLIVELTNTDLIYDRAQIAFEISWQLKDINPDSSLYYAEKSFEYAKLSKQSKLEAYSLSNIGNYYKRNENYKEALTQYLKSLEIRKKTGVQEDIASGYNQIGLLYKQQEKYDSASFYFKEGLKTLRSGANSKLKAKLISSYGMTLYHLGRPSLAMLHLDSAYNIAQEFNDSLVIIELIQNKGAINQYLGNYTLALKFYEEAQEYYSKNQNNRGKIDIQINRASIYLLQGEITNAENLLIEAETLSTKFGFQNNLSSVYIDLAELYENLDNSKTKLYFEKAYNYSKGSDKIRLQIESGLGLTKTEISNENTDRALELLNEIEPLVKVENSISHNIEFYLTKSLFLRTKGLFKEALLLSEKAADLKDSMDNELREIQDLSALLEVSNQEKRTIEEDLRAKKSEAEKAILDNKFNTLVLWIFGIVIIFSFFLIWTIIRRYKDRMKITTIQHEKDEDRKKFELKIKFLTYEADLGYLEDRLTLEEEIRIKIGQDLHDQLASKMAVIQIVLVSMLQGKFGSEQSSIQLKNAIDQIDECCQDIRDISHDLINEKLIADSLNQNFRKRCKTISDHYTTKIEFISIGSPYLITIDIKKNLLATVELLIDNVLRHAQAKKATLQFFYYSDNINVELNDDGIGFEIAMKEKQGGVGLENAKSRVKNMQGTFEIYSKRNKGTSISITIPINHE